MLIVLYIPHDIAPNNFLKKYTCVSVPPRLKMHVSSERRTNHYVLKSSTFHIAIHIDHIKSIALRVAVCVCGCGYVVCACGSERERAR